MTRRVEVPFTVACDFDPARPEVPLRSHSADVAVRRGAVPNSLRRAGPAGILNLRASRTPAADSWQQRAAGGGV